MKTMKRLGLVLLLAVSPVAMMAQLSQGIDAESKGNYKQALLFYQKSSDAEAKYRMGRLYENGWGVPKNMSTARYYYNQAAKAGHAKAQSIMGTNKPATQATRPQTQTATRPQVTTQTQTTTTSAASPQQTTAPVAKLDGVNGIGDVFKGTRRGSSYGYNYVYLNTSSNSLGNAKKVALNQYAFETVDGAKFYEGIAGVVNEENHLVGFVDEQGNLLPGGYKWDYGIEYFPHFGGGAALVSTHTGVTSYERVNTYYILKKDGSTAKVNLGGQIHKARNFNADGIACVILKKTNAKGQNTYTKMYINTSGQAVYRNLWSGTDGWGDSSAEPTDLGVFKDGLARFYDRGMYGFVNRAGTIVVSAKYYEAEEFSEGLAAVQTEINGARKWIYINTSGAQAIQIAFTTRPGNFRKGYAPVKKANGTYNYIDKTGKQQLSTDVYGATEFFPNGCAIIRTENNNSKNATCAVITTQFKKHVTFKYDLMAYERANAPIYWNGLALMAPGPYDRHSQFLDLNSGVVYTLANITNFHIASDNLIQGDIEVDAFSPSKKAFANINGCRWTFYFDKDEF